MQTIQSIDEQNKIDLIKLITSNASKLAISLSDVVPLEYSNMVASSLVEIYFKENLEMNIIKDFITHEVKKTRDTSTLYRENNCSSLVITTIFKICGESYLKKSISTSLKKICSLKEVIETDQTKVKPGTNIEKSVQLLAEYSKKILDSIFSTIDKCPFIIRKICSILKDSLQTRFPEDDALSIITGFLFLRFYCPAVFDPVSYHIVHHAPTREGRRVLVLISKILQVLANDSTYGDSQDSSLLLINQFIDENRSKIRIFVEAISRIPDEDTPTTPEKNNYYSKILKGGVGEGINNIVPLLIRYHDKIESNLQSSSNSNQENNPAVMLKKILNEIEFYEERFTEQTKTKKHSNNDSDSKKKTALKRHNSDNSNNPNVMPVVYINPLFRVNLSSITGNNAHTQQTNSSTLNSANQNLPQNLYQYSSQNYQFPHLPNFGEGKKKITFAVQDEKIEGDETINFRVSKQPTPFGHIKVQIPISSPQSMDDNNTPHRVNSKSLIKSEPIILEKKNKIKKSVSDDQIRNTLENSNIMFYDDDEKEVKEIQKQTISQLHNRIQYLEREIEMRSHVVAENHKLKIKLKEVTMKMTNYNGGK